MARNNQTDKKSQLNQLLNGMDKPVADSFTHTQRKALQKSINSQGWRKHNVDIRPTLALPFLPWSFYIVFLVGINKRGLLPVERFMAAIMFLLIVFLIGLFIIGCAFLLIYLLKSWLGIDLFVNESLGIWDEFKSYF